jgi:hypothetical protein
MVIEYITFKITMSKGTKDWLSLFIICYLALPLILFWAGWFSVWVALPAIVAFIWLVFGQFRLLSIASPTDVSASLGCILLAFVWVYLAGVGGFRPQHFDYFKHNLIFNNLVVYDWPVRYADGSWLCYYLAYYLPAAGLAKMVGGLAMVHYYIFGWAWLGLILLFLLLYRIGSWGLLIFFMFFNSIEAILLVYEGFKLPYTFTDTLIDLWANDHTIELVMSPGGLAFPSHVESLTAVPQHAIGGWLVVGLFLNFISHSADKKNAILPLLLTIVLAYWSPFVVVGMLPFVGYWFFKNIETKVSFGLSFWLNFLALAAISCPVLVYYSGHLPIADAHGWWWEFINTRHQYLLWVVFVVIEVFIWAFWVLFFEQSCQILRSSFRVVLMSLLVLFLLAIYRYGHFNDLARRASLSASMVLCWGLWQYANALFFNHIKISTIAFGCCLFVGALLPIKHHIMWFSERPYTVITDKKISDFTPHTIYYLSRHHVGEFDVVAQYLGHKNSLCNRYFLAKTDK